MNDTALMEPPPTPLPPVLDDVPAESPVAAPEPARPHVLVRTARWIGSAFEWMFGALTMIVTLAVFAVIPLLNLLSLGYLLEVSGRVARTGRLRNAFIGIRKAAVFGRMVAGTWLVLWPVRFFSGMWQDAELIAPGSAKAAGWRIALILFTVLTAWHILWACLRGGKLRHFLWPAPLRFLRWLRAGAQYEPIRNAVLDYLASLRLPHFKLGGLGFVGAVAWLIVPVGILVMAASLPPGGAALLSLVGGALLALVALHLPFVQAHYAVENRFAAMFELGQVRALFRRAPVAFWLALLVTLLFSLPLYLLKIEFPPKEIAWLPSLLFVVFILPARALAGWAMGRALRREEPRHFVFRWLGRLGAVPVVGFYVFFVYLTQYLSWHGALSLLEQHAFLVPAPMLSM
jgi:hypothetical protein